MQLLNDETLNWCNGVIPKLLKLTICTARSNS